jgi:hypothetical protein
VSTVLGAEDRFAFGRDQAASDTGAALNGV